MTIVSLAFNGTKKMDLFRKAWEDVNNEDLSYEVHPPNNDSFFHVFIKFPYAFQLSDLFYLGKWVAWEQAHVKP